MSPTEPWIAVSAVCFRHGSPRLCFCWLAVGLTLLLAGRAVAQGPPGGPTAQPVVAAKIFVKDRLPIERTFVGTVLPKRVSQVGSTVEGRVIELFVEEGDHVKTGDKLAQLRDESLKIDLAAAEAELDLLQRQLERLEAAGPKEIEQAEARKGAAEALKDVTEARQLRGKSLHASNRTMISEDDLEEIISAAVAATNIFEERSIGHELAIETLPIDVKIAGAKIRAQKEKINGLKDDIAEHTIRAPFDGYVSEEHTEVGQWVAKGGLVFEVVDLAEVDIELPVLETYVPRLRVPSKDQPGTPTLRVEIGALPDIELQGEVVSIVPQADLSARTFPVKVRVPNPRVGDHDVLLKPGMFARVMLPLGELPGVVLVPKDALVLHEDGKKEVWVIRPEADFKQSRLGRAVKIRVALGETDEGWIQVQRFDADQPDFLRSGELVIVEGNERINPTAKVRVGSIVLHPDEKKGLHERTRPDR